MRNALYTELAKTKLFVGVSSDAMSRLLEWCKVVDAEPGLVLIEAGSSNESVYVVLDGTLHVHLSSIEHPAHAVLSEGDCAGEMSIIEGRETSASVVVGAPSRLLVIPKDVLWSLINSSHGVARNMLYILSGRLRQDNEAVKESIRLQVEFETMAFVDGLTGLHNRRWLDQAFRRQVERNLRDRQPLSMLMMDIDHFKRYNDAYGHLAADKSLRSVAATLNDNLRPGDLLARFGGEEFALVLLNTDREQAMAVAERLRKAVADTEIIGAPEMPKVTVSVGCTQLSANDTLERILERADSALYLAKNAGRNCVKTA